MSDEKTPPAEAGDKSGYHKDGGEWAPMGCTGLRSEELPGGG